ncbi:MAG TPA: hypothetical protein VGM90_34470 [Kofleriaceae bacterium]|jgi:hypothetical protein
MRNRYDELAKQIGERALAPCGLTTPQFRITPEPQFADLRHEPDLARDEERARLGLLGRIAAHPCLIEVYSRAPGPEDLRACLAKHLAFWHERTRAGMTTPPDLWILAAGAPRSVLVAVPFELAVSWPTGVYQLGGDVLRVHLVVVGELPIDPTTLLVRLMAGGPFLPPAIRELASLPAGATARAIADPVLLQLKHLFEQRDELQPDEKEFIMAMYESLWDELREEGRKAGQEEGRVEAQRELLRKLIELKFGEITADVDARIANASSEELQHYVERILFADSLAALFT